QGQVAVDQDLVGLDELVGAEQQVAAGGGFRDGQRQVAPDGGAARGVDRPVEIVGGQQAVDGEVGEIARHVRLVVGEVVTGDGHGRQAAAAHVVVPDADAIGVSVELVVPVDRHGAHRTAVDLNADRVVDRAADRVVAHDRAGHRRGVVVALHPDADAGVGDGIALDEDVAAVDGEDAGGRPAGRV